MRRLIQAIASGSALFVSGQKLLVAALDFGTAYSGWAYSFRHEFMTDATNVFTRRWTGGSQLSLKAPTCVLIKPDGKTFHSFGYEAENKYAEMAEDGDHGAWYFFQRFKMLLFDRLSLERNILLSDATDKQLPAARVFSLVINYLKDDLLKQTRSRINDIQLDDIHWVLTVPGIWNDAAKQFMRECAIMAGIGSDNLSIALEPEAASLYCRHIPVEKNKGTDGFSLASLPTGSKYLVLDAGAGTVDVTVHQVQSDGSLKELWKATGGAWGGTKVDQEFANFLAKLFGKHVMKSFKQKHMDDYLDIFRDFEHKKRNIALTKIDKVTLRIPCSLAEIYTCMMGVTVKDGISNSEYADKIECKALDKMRLDASILKQFLNVSIESILDHIERLLEETTPSCFEAIVMVGGFAESPMLQEYMRKKHKRMKIVIPEEAGLAVLKGAVIFGHKPSAISSRVCKFTYGLEKLSHFDENVHPASKKFIWNGTPRCFDVFDIHVKAGQEVWYGEAQVEKRYDAVCDAQTAMEFTVYVSSSPCPRFVTDEGCYKLGKFSLSLPEGANRKDNGVKVRMIFGGTEILIETVTELTGEVSKASVDFLG